jgi:CheY-like chemotaxis protein
LEDEGYCVLTAQDGVEALALLRAADYPMVVLLDYVMPRLSGLDVLNAVRADERLYAGRAFVLCTAQANALPPELHVLRAQLGAPVLAKPFNLETLLSIIASAALRLTQDLAPSPAQESTVRQSATRASNPFVPDSGGSDTMMAC